MGSKSAIEWTDATWNPTRGCSRISPGCEHCYAETVAARFSGPGQPYEGLAERVNGHPRWMNRVQLVPAALDLPRRWKAPRRIFVDSMSDLFHVDVPFEFIARVFVVMHVARQHTYQILTKRPKRMRSFIAWFQSEEYGGHIRYGSAWPAEYPHVWFGVSVEDQQRADERIPILAETPAAVRFLSCEPLLGPLNLAPWLWNEGQEPAIDWVIAGGESGGPPERALVRRCGNCGSGARASQCIYCHGRPWQAKPEALGWVRALRDQCVEADVAFFWKQWGGPLPTSGGHELDGRTWQHFPLTAVPA